MHISCPQRRCPQTTRRDIFPGRNRNREGAQLAVHNTKFAKHHSHSKEVLPKGTKQWNVCCFTLLIILTLTLFINIFMDIHYFLNRTVNHQ